jgi:hypothetical protein
MFCKMLVAICFWNTPSVFNFFSYHYSSYYVLKIIIYFIIIDFCYVDDF